jgi:hypothetical protein
MALPSGHFSRAAAKEEPIELMGDVKQVLPCTLDLRFTAPSKIAACSSIVNRQS